MIPTPPNWFLGKDVMIDSFSFLVLIAFFVLCWRNYNLSEKKKFRYLGFGFLLIAVAQLAAIFTKIVLYDYFTFTQTIGQMVVTYNVVKPINIDFFYKLGFFFQKFLTLLGLYIIYRIPVKNNSLRDFIFAVAFIIISAFYSIKTYDSLYHLTILVFLGLIIANYIVIYQKNKSGNTLILILAFSILGFGHLIYTISEYQQFFVIANVLELVSYLILLILMIRILYYGKEKKSDGYSVGYAGNSPRKRRGN